MVEKFCDSGINTERMEVAVDLFPPHLSYIIVIIGLNSFCVTNLTNDF